MKKLFEWMDRFEKRVTKEVENSNWLPSKKEEAIIQKWTDRFMNFNRLIEEPCLSDEERIRYCIIAPIVIYSEIFKEVQFPSGWQIEHKLFFILNKMYQRIFIQSIEKA